MQVALIHEGAGSRTTPLGKARTRDGQKDYPMENESLNRNDSCYKFGTKARDCRSLKGALPCSLNQRGDIPEVQASPSCPLRTASRGVTKTERR